MKKNYLLFLLILLMSIAKAQNSDTVVNVISRDSLQMQSNDTTSNFTDSGKVNKYGDLLHDDPEFNPKYAWWKPAVRVLAADVFNWGIARYAYKFDWAKVSTKDWKNNIKKGPEWDVDGFGINFIGHPHTGNFYYNVARSNGYSYWQSIPYVIQGSVLWEYLGENTRPSYNDLINTPISGMFLGEIFYRLSSNVLDDRKRGAERVFREILAGIINPPRALNRFTQRKMFRVTTKEVYQKAPLNILLAGGMQLINDKVGSDNKFGTGTSTAIVNLQLDYGDPFEVVKRKPFDVFRLRVELSDRKDKNFLDHVNGYGLLAGKNLKPERLLGGIFQHYDYWRNSIFQVASLGFGGGLIARIPVSKKSNLYSAFHLAVVPLAGNNTQFGPDTSDYRRYNFGGGLQAKLEETFNLSKWATFGFTGFYYFIHTYNGVPGNSMVTILRPRVTVKLFKKLHIGMEHHVYHNDRFLKNNENLHLTRTEQRVFLQLFFEDGKRYGKYH